MPDTHCSKCCPVEPPEPPAEVSWPAAALLWLAGLVVVAGGGYVLVIWAASSVFA